MLRAARGSAMSRGMILLLGLSAREREILSRGLDRADFEVTAVSGEPGEFPSGRDVMLCVADDSHGADRLEGRVRSLGKVLAGVPIAVIAESLGAGTAFRLARLGVVEIFEQPLLPHELIAGVIDCAESWLAGSTEELIVGDSQAMARVREDIASVAPTDSTVLLLGETGTGKGLVAKEIHERSRRSHGNFVHVDCTVFASTVIESELFGHERGAFTGALERRRGRFESAAGGTIFLDEIGELDVGLQAKLLRVLQDRVYERVGGSTPLEMSARVIAATNKDLPQAVREGRFRRDLFYRLNVYQIPLPPLRERASDIGSIVRFALYTIAERLAVPVPGVADDFIAALKLRAWPGNVRELLNVLERCLIQHRVDRLEARDLEGILDEGELADEQDKVNRYLLRSKWRACIPIAVRSGQLEDIVKKFLTNKPEIRHFSAASLVGAAMANAFPCK